MLPKSLSSRIFPPPFAPEIVAPEGEVTLVFTDIQGFWIFQIVVVNSGRTRINNTVGNASRRHARSSFPTQCSIEKNVEGRFWIWGENRGWCFYGKLLTPWAVFSSIDVSLHWKANNANNILGLLIVGLRQFRWRSPLRSTPFVGPLRYKRTYSTSIGQMIFTGNEEASPPKQLGDGYIVVSFSLICVVGTLMQQ